MRWSWVKKSIEKRYRITIERVYFYLLQSADKGSLTSSILLSPLIIFSYIYAFFFLIIRYIRRLRKKKPSYFCITVGNIVMGGTGKTPLIAKIIHDVGDPYPLYIARGYGRRDVDSFTLENGSHTSFSSCGDEAMLLSQRFPNIICAVAGSAGKEHALYCKEVKQAMSDNRRYIIVDDAFQHDEIDFDIKIVTIDAENPYGYGWLLPRGLLREYPSWNLHNADYIVLTNCSHALNEVFHLQHEIEARWKRPVIPMKTVLKRFFSYNGESAILPTYADLYVVSAIAHPSRVISLLEENLKFQEIKGHYIAPDHAEISLKEISSWLIKEREKEEKKSAPLIMIATEKDWVRRSDWGNFPIPIFFMEIDYIPLSNIESWHECIQKIKNILR